MSENKPHELDGLFTEQSVVVKTPKGPVTYLIREFDGDGQSAYLAWVRDNTVRDENGQPLGLTDFTGFHIILLLQCLFTTDGKPVDETTMRSWPSRLLKELADIARRLNGLDGKADETAKNDSSPTPS